MLLGLGLWTVGSGLNVVNCDETGSQQQIVSPICWAFFVALGSYFNTAPKTGKSRIGPSILNCHQS